MDIDSHSGFPHRPHFAHRHGYGSHGFPVGDGHGVGPMVRPHFGKHGCKSVDKEARKQAKQEWKLRKQERKAAQCGWKCKNRDGKCKKSCGGGSDSCSTSSSSSSDSSSD